MNADLFQTIEPDLPVDVFQDSHEQMAAHELDLERQYDIEQALRECLTIGVSMQSIRVLCAETGVSLRQVIGE